MPTTKERYDALAKQYTDGARALLVPLSRQPQGPLQRSAQKALTSPERLSRQAGDLAPVSRDLTKAAADRLEDKDPIVRAEAATQLLAKAMVDFQVSMALYQAAQDEEMARTMPAGREIEREALSLPGLDESLALILGQPVKETVALHRGIALTSDVPFARQQLNQAVSDILTLIEQRAGKSAQAALSGLLTIGIGNVAKAAGLVGMNIAQTMGAADKITEIYILFRQFFTNAYNALVSLLGVELTKAAATQVVSWVNQILQGQMFIDLLGKLYEIEITRSDLAGQIEESQGKLEQYMVSLRSLDTLNGQYLKQIGVIEKMIQVLKFVAGIPPAAMPQAQIILGATYVVLTGYVIFAGADYVDAPHFQKLDRIPGPRRIITLNLGEPASTPLPRPVPQEPAPPPPPAGGVSYEVPAGWAHAKPPSHDEREAPQAVAADDTTQIEEKIRLDLAVPDSAVVVGEVFEIAVAIRQPKSAILTVDGLGSASSGSGSIFRSSASDIVNYRVKVIAPDCDIELDEYNFRLRAGHDSEPYFFQLTPRKPGLLSIIVNAYQDDKNLAAQTHVRLQATVQSVAPAQPDIVEKHTSQYQALSPEKRYINLDIELFEYEINDQQEERFKVRVICAPLAGEQKIADADQVLVPAGLRQQLGLLKRRALKDDEITALGKQLGSMLLPERSRWYFESSRGKIEDGQVLRVRIKIDTFALADIAWEYAYVTPRDAPPGFDGPEGFIALDREISLVRYEVMGQPLVSLDPVGSGSLRMLLLMANSSDPALPRLDLDTEQKNIRDALARIPGIDLDVRPDATISTLLDSLIDPAHIFHFAGHGTFQSEMGPIRNTVVGEGFLVLADQPPDEGLFSASKLALNLKGSGVRLAVLGVCEGGERDPVNAWTGIAPALARSGIPAVVAMQFSVYDRSAVEFHRSLYRALAAGQAIDAAVSAGRLAIFSRPNTDRDWGVPVLYLRADEGVLFPRDGWRDSEVAAAVQPVVAHVDLQPQAAPKISAKPQEPAGQTVSEPPDPNQERRDSLYEALSGKAFEMDDLEDICFKLNIDWDNLKGETKRDKARSMIRYFESRGAFDRLYQAVRKARPDLNLP